MTWFLVRAVYLACRQMFSCCIFTCALPWCPNTCMHTHTHTHNTHTTHTHTHNTHAHTHRQHTQHKQHTEHIHNTCTHTHTRTHNMHTHNTHMCMRARTHTHTCACVRTHTHTHTSPLMSLLKKKLILSGQGPTLMTSFNLNFPLKTPSSNKPQKRLEEKLQYKQ